MVKANGKKLMSVPKHPSVKKRKKPIPQKTIQSTRNANQLTDFCITRDSTEKYFQTDCNNNHRIIISSTEMLNIFSINLSTNKLY